MTRRFLKVSGTDAECGYQQGMAFRHAINSILEAIREIEILPWNLQKLLPLTCYRGIFFCEGRSFLKFHRALLDGQAGLPVKNKLKGLAEGLGVSLPFAYGLSALEALSSEMPHRAQMGCTSLVFDDTHTTERAPVLAYNHDFPQSFGPHLIVRQNEPGEGLRSVSLTYPILLGCIAGVNESGLAVTINHAFEKNIVKNQPALFVTWLLQECLNTCRDVDAAVALILKTPVTNGSMITLLDTSGKCAVVEVSSRVRVLRKPEPAACYTFNKYRTPELEALELPLDTVGTGMFHGRLVHESNIKRLERFHEIFNADKIYADEAIRQILSDHDGTSGDMHTLCRHHKATASTIASAILKPASGEMKVIFGSACQGEYETFRV